MAHDLRPIRQVGPHVRLCPPSHGGKTWFGGSGPRRAARASGAAIAGATYLLYLAWRTAWADAGNGAIARAKPISFAEAALFQWINPKGWVFALGALAAYTTVGGNVLLETSIIATVNAAACLLSVVIWAGFGVVIGRFLDHPIETFAEAAALGAGCAIPNATDEAQYSLPHPVAAALVFGQIGAEEIELPRLADPRIRRLLAAMTVTEDAEFSRRFPAERWARVRITLRDGRMLASEPAIARGNPENPLTDNELRGKYRSLAEPVLGVGRAAQIERLVDALQVDPAALRLLIDDLMLAPS